MSQILFSSVFDEGFLLRSAVNFPKVAVQNSPLLEFLITKFTGVFSSFTVNVSVNRKSFFTHFLRAEHTFDKTSFNRFISFLMDLPAMFFKIASISKRFITEKALLSLRMFTLMSIQTCPGDKSGLTLETFVVQILFSDFSLKEMQFFGMNFSLVNVEITYRREFCVAENALGVFCAKFLDLSNRF